MVQLGSDDSAESTGSKCIIRYKVVQPCLSRILRRCEVLTGVQTGSANGRVEAIRCARKYRAQTKAATGSGFELT